MFGGAPFGWQYFGGGRTSVLITMASPLVSATAATKTATSSAGASTTPPQASGLAATKASSSTAGATATPHTTAASAANTKASSSAGATATPHTTAAAAASTKATATAGAAATPHTVAASASIRVPSATAGATTNAFTGGAQGFVYLWAGVVTPTVVGHWIPGSTTGFVGPSSSSNGASVIMGPTSADGIVLKTVSLVIGQSVSAHPISGSAAKAQGSAAAGAVATPLPASAEAVAWVVVAPTTTVGIVGYCSTVVLAIGRVRDRQMPVGVAQSSVALVGHVTQTVTFPTLVSQSVNTVGEVLTSR